MPYERPPLQVKKDYGVSFFETDFSINLYCLLEFLLHMMTVKVF